MKIGVLCGGVSAERMISLASGEAVFGALKRCGSDAVLIDITSQDGAKAQIQQAGIDLAFIALHGPFGEDGEVQSLLEEMDIPYTGSGVVACRRGMDKAQAKTLFRACGIPTPDWVVMKDHERVTPHGKYPVVLKPRSQGSSLGISIVQAEGEWTQALETAFRFGKTHLVETHVAGDEVAVGILGTSALPVIRLFPKRAFYDFHAKYDEGLVEYEVPARIDPVLTRKIQETALAAHRALGCYGFSRVDIILDRDGAPWVLEVNTVPGLMDKSLLPKAAFIRGISFDELVIRIVKMAIERQDAIKTQSV